MKFPRRLPTNSSDVNLLTDLSAEEWSAMLALGRRHGVAGRWHRLLETNGQLERILPRVRQHLWSAHLVAEERVRSILWEINRVEHAFKGTDLPVVVLKGGAYILLALPPSSSRLTSDLDILVPHHRLKEAETILQAHGWQTTSHTDYDEHYYREWMHELPPLQHVGRGAVLDLHHNLLPRTARLVPDAAALFADSRAVTGHRSRVLSPVDMALHSIVHGFYGGELTNAFRDTLDVHELVSYFAERESSFFTALLARVAQFKLEGPTYYALTMAVRNFGTCVPDDMQKDLRAKATWWPIRVPTAWAMQRSFLPHLPASRLERSALSGLYMRSHWLKMPPRMLATHLWTKYRMRRMTSNET